MINCVLFFFKNTTQYVDNSLSRRSVFVLFFIVYNTVLSVYQHRVNKKKKIVLCFCYDKLTTQFKQDEEKQFKNILCCVNKFCFSSSCLPQHNMLSVYHIVLCKQLKKKNKTKTLLLVYPVLSVYHIVLKNKTKTQLLVWQHRVNKKKKNKTSMCFCFVFHNSLSIVLCFCFVFLFCLPCVVSLSYCVVFLFCFSSSCLQHCVVSLSYCVVFLFCFSSSQHNC